MHKKHSTAENEPEDAGLIQSTPPTEQELQEISRFIAQSKQRNGSVEEDHPPGSAEKAVHNIGA